MDYRDLRALSVAAFGPPADSVKLILNGSIQAVYHYLEGTEQEEIQDLVEAYPFLERLCESPVTLPPPVPHLQPSTLERVLTDFIRNCRLYRKKFPTYDRATKMYQRFPTNASTAVKFDLGIGTAGCTHFGAGRIIGSSVSDASIFVDWQQGTEAFGKKVDTEMVVSDLAIPDEDGLGCGTYPGLVTMVEQWEKQGKFILVKLNLFDYYRILEQGSPIKILYKPRKHNLEVICSLNIPGVELDQEAVLEGILEENVIRNNKIYAQDNSTDEEFEKIHVELFSDDKDYDKLIEGLDFSKLTVYAAEKIKPPMPEPSQLNSLMEAGFNTWNDNVDAKALLHLGNVVQKYETGQAFSPPPLVKELYDSWPMIYKAPRKINLANVFANGGCTTLNAILTIPVARIAAEMYMYSAEKINNLYQILILNQLGRVLLERYGNRQTLQELSEEYANYAR
jgi:hypothetical protein